MVSLCGTNHGFDHGQYWNEIYAKMIKSHVMGLDLGHSYGIYQVDQNLPLYPKKFLHYFHFR
jgi:hypothetical protein